MWQLAEKFPTLVAKFLNEVRLDDYEVYSGAPRMAARVYETVSES